MSKRTELEVHVFDHFKGSKDPEFSVDNLKENSHLLIEWFDGYQYKNDDGKYCYADPNDPSHEKLLNDFIHIVGSDIEGSYEYNANDFTNVILKAIETFGL